MSALNVNRLLSCFRGTAYDTTVEVARYVQSRWKLIICAHYFLAESLGVFLYCFHTYCKLSVKFFMIEL